MQHRNRWTIGKQLDMVLVVASLCLVIFGAVTFMRIHAEYRSKINESHYLIKDEDTGSYELQ